MHVPPENANRWTPPSTEERERALLAPYAVHSADTQGRRYAEPPHPYRGPFQRDRDRIIHSAAYRRLSDKMQVFTGDQGDYHRTRLTHTLEVASIARTLARALRLNEDLVEALALMHDLGHPPFGHAGEDALDECLAEEGGFCHNRHALRLVEELEQRYQEFPGLNLSHEVLEGQAERTEKRERPPQPPLEVQAVDAADSAAYDTHDADDALELGFLSLEALLENRLWHEAARRVRRRYQALTDKELRRAVLHELIDWQVGDLLEGTFAHLAQQRIESVAAVQASAALLRPSSELAEQKEELERFLFESVYQHPDVLRLRERSQAMLGEMFRGYSARPDLLPTRYRSRIAEVGLARSVGDYLAGMTDRYAERAFGHHFAASSPT